MEKASEMLETILFFGVGEFRVLERGKEILAKGEMFVVALELEDHAKVALVGWNVVGGAVEERDGALVEGSETGDGMEQGGLATAARTEQAEPFSLVDLE